MLIHNGFIYNIEKSSPENLQYWRCQKRRTLFCKGSITTICNDGVYKAVNCKNHCHISDAGAIVNHKFKEVIKTAAITTTETPARIHQRQFSQLDENEAFYAPSLSTCRQAIKRMRKNDIPSEPLSLSDYVVPPIFDTFCLKDIEDDKNNRIIIFGKNEHIELLCKSSFIIMDGTFYIVSQLFYQLYTIHAQISPGNSPTETAPVIYALMSSKNAESYRLLLNSLKKLAVDRNYHLDPERILTDMEDAMIKVVAEVVTKFNLN